MSNSESGRDRLVGVLCSVLGVLFGLGRLGRRSRPPAAPRRIVIVKPCCLGDVLFTTPLLAVLRRSYPQAQITFAVGQWSRQMLQNNPRLDSLLDSGPVGSGRYGLHQYMALARRLRSGRFDMAIIPDRSPALGLLAFLAGIPVRVGLDSGGRGFAHTVQVPVDWDHPKHEADLYGDCARALGLHVAEPRLEFYPSAEDRRQAGALLVELGLAEAGQPLAAIHAGGAANPGMTLPAKRWNPERFAAIADRLADHYDARILLIGAESDREAAQAVQRAMSHQPALLVGRTTLGQLAALYDDCFVMVGNDTGPMHLAAAVGTPVVAVYGPSDVRVYGPYTARGIGVRKDTGCDRRCFARGRALAVHCDRTCIEAVTVPDVWQAIQAVLGEQA